MEKGNLSRKRPLEVFWACFAEVFASFGVLERLKLHSLRTESLALKCKSPFGLVCSDKAFEWSDSSMKFSCASTEQSESFLQWPQHEKQTNFCSSEKEMKAFPKLVDPLPKIH